MIRDRIVVGIRNAALSEKLKLDSDLTLEKAVTQARQAEAIKKQQLLVRGGSGEKPVSTELAPVGGVHKGKDSKGSHNSGATSHKQPGSSKKCSRCGKYPAHDQQRCPA